MKQIICVPNETTETEYRVAITPKTVSQLTQLGFQVCVQKNAGAKALFEDTAYKESGAEIIANAEELYKKAEIVLALNPPGKIKGSPRNHMYFLKKGSVWICAGIPDEEIINACEKAEIKVFSLVKLPRISRAQRMDVLSSQSNIAGYKAVIMAAHHSHKLFPLMMTAAGTISPARVIILGAGVAGLQAIATAKRLGAIVEASDVRPEVKEQIESLGGKFIEVESTENASDSQGYAKEVSQDYLKKQAAEVRKRLAYADVVITTALVGGKKAPILISEDMVKEMKHGAVIVDMAAVQGGNCACTILGRIITKHGVTIVGHTHITSTSAIDASSMYSNNVSAFLQHITKEGELNLDPDDPLCKDTLITQKLMPAKKDEPSVKTKTKSTKKVGARK